METDFLSSLLLSEVKPKVDLKSDRSSFSVWWFCFILIEKLLSSKGSWERREKFLFLAKDASPKPSCVC